jgi:hypothetical protein
MFHKPSAFGLNTMILSRVIGALSLSPSSSKNEPVRNRTLAQLQRIDALSRTADLYAKRSEGPLP